MTNPNKTLIGLLIDRSGSMTTIKDDMEGGIKTFLEDQHDAPGETEIAVAYFSNGFELDYPIGPLSEDSVVEIRPGGTTALNDAVGRFITYIGEELADRDEDDRPGIVIINIVTDGLENSSRFWTLEKVRELILQQRTVYNWEFIFTGEELNAETQAREYGFSADRTVKYTGRQSVEGMNCGSMTHYTRTIRGRQ